jgi:hypothetical protein
MALLEPRRSRRDNSRRLVAMIISQTLVKTYPDIAVWICDNLPMVRNKPKIFKAFQKYARLDGKASERAIKHSALPNIDFRNLPAVNGEYNSKWPTFVFISQTICEKFRDANAADRSAMATLIESTILHEMVHWGNSLDGKRNSHAEMGKAFEIEAYGKDVRAPWSTTP